MARPHKQTVDYFPHDTDACEGKTLTIIQSKYGNDGYAFWFKLLQLLGKAPGHYYDFNNPADWEFLLAKTHQKDTEKVKGILKTLVMLGAIDDELYSYGVIWCQKFVDRIADAYNRTVDGVPQRPDFLVKVGNKGISVPNNNVSTNRNPENITEIPQTKLKETKLKETKLDKRNKPLKQKFGEFLNVFLTTEEYGKLVNKFGVAGTETRIEELSSAIESKGYRYHSHYATILMWARREQKQGDKGGTHRPDRSVKRSDDPDKYIKGSKGHMVNR